MDFDLTADQKLFRATTREFLEKEMPLTRVRELADRGIGFEPDWWKRGSELGWNSMVVDPAAGGDSISGEGLVDACIVAEEMGRLVAPGPPDGPAQFIVPATAPGVRVTAEQSLDLVRRYARVDMDGVELPATSVVSPAGTVEAAVNRQIQIAVALQCAETAGAIQRVFEFTVQWAFDRYSFGRPLASYQALKHRFADMKLWLEACQATTSAAAHATARQAEEADELASVAKSCGATVLDMASEEQKRQHLPAVIRGDEVMVQFLSEPRGGSDLAGVTTRATRDGDVFILSGSKIWSSGAYAADWALCLARTDWEAPKHRGMTMFLLKVHQPGIEIKRIKQINGNNEFCQEFFDDVVVPASNVVGEVNGGWAVASRQLFHERNAVGGGSPYVSGGVGPPRRGPGTHALIDMVRATGQSDDIYVRELVAEAHAIARIQQQLISRVTDGMRTQQLPPPAAAIMRLFAGQASTRLAEIGVEVLGSHAVAGRQGLDYGRSFLMRQAGSLGGGSTEMARNIISERVLGMPREFAADRDVPFSQVRQGR